MSLSFAIVTALLTVGSAVGAFSGGNAEKGLRGTVFERKLDEVFCSSQPCPSGYIPIVDAGLVACTNDVCSEAQCCEKVNEDAAEVAPGTLLCNSIGCPAGYTPIPDAQDIECAGACEVDQCCEAFCSYFACSDGYIPIVHADLVPCTNNLCTDAQCCEMPTNGGDNDDGMSYEYVYDPGMSYDFV